MLNFLHFLQYLQNVFFAILLSFVLVAHQAGSTRVLLPDQSSSNSPNESNVSIDYAIYSENALPEPALWTVYRLVQTSTITTTISRAYDNKRYTVYCLIRLMRHISIGGEAVITLK